MVPLLRERCVLLRMAIAGATGDGIGSQGKEARMERWLHCTTSPGDAAKGDANSASEWLFIACKVQR
jgi:hypothetical protein